MSAPTLREISELEHQCNASGRNVFDAIAALFAGRWESPSDKDIAEMRGRAAGEYEARRLAAIALIGKSAMSPSRPGVTGRPFVVLDVTDERDGSHNVRMSGGQYIPLWEFSEKWKVVENAPAK